ncbi:MAG: metalloregulator ArsR/SmtB family transcription factor [Acidimicrobiia bacterium]
MRTDEVFRALSSAVRRTILVHLRNGELSAGEIASRFRLAAPTISRHLGVLKTASLVSERRDGNRIFYRAHPDRVANTLTGFVGKVLPAGGGRRGSSRGEES